MAVNISRICGIIAPLSGLLFIWIAVHNSPWFRWIEEDLSVLGEKGSATAFFSWGLALSALLSMLFVIGLSKGLFSQNQPMGYTGIILLVLGSLALAMVGLFPRTKIIPHNITSIAFFTLVPSGIFFRSLFNKIRAIALGVI